MDRGTVVGFRANQLEAIRADQALFTSIRSPMGEGYRIVATSPGVRPEERSEITRWSPSHGSLCSAESSAEGICSYPLPTGRQCIAHSRYAGTEHTARGGQRVQTHIVLVSRQDFARLGCNPLRLWGSVPQMVETESNEKIPPQLPPLQIEPDPHQVLSAGGLVGLDPAVLCGITSDLLAGERLIIFGAKRPFAALEWALMLLPATVRSKITVCAGLRVSPTRPVDLAWVQPDNGETSRAIAGQPVRLLDLSKVNLEAEPAPREYFALLRRWWAERRWDEICQLTTSLSGRHGQVELTRIATICQAIDDAAVADAPRLTQYRATWQRLRAGSDTERELVDRLGQVIDARTRVLEREGFATKGTVSNARENTAPRTAKIGA